MGNGGWKVALALGFMVIIQVVVNVSARITV